MTTTLQVRLSAREMARLIDGKTVEIHANDRTIVLTGPPPDWEEPDVEAREAQAAYDDEWVGRRS